MRVNELAEQLNITADTVRYYTRIDLLKPVKNQENGYKDYTLTEKKRLIFILKAKNLGFTISEILQIIDMSTHGKSPCCEVRKLVNHHIIETQQKINELQKQQKYMQQATLAWESMPDSMPDGDSVCELIELWDTIDVCEPV